MQLSSHLTTEAKCHCITTENFLIRIVSFCIWQPIHCYSLNETRIAECKNYMREMWERVYWNNSAAPSIVNSCVATFLRMPNYLLNLLSYCSKWLPALMSLWDTSGWPWRRSVLVPRENSTYQWVNVMREKHPATQYNSKLHSVCKAHQHNFQSSVHIHMNGSD
jgi:hypothetical protein